MIEFVIYLCFIHLAYRTVSGVNGPLVILDNVKVIFKPEILVVFYQIRLELF